MNNTNELCHYGTLGMRWGIRKYQYADGSLTPEGMKRYRKLTEKMSRVTPSDLRKRKYRKMREDLVILLGGTTLRDIEKSKSKSESHSDSDNPASMTRDEWLKEMKARTYALQVENNYLTEKNFNLEKRNYYDKLTTPPKKQGVVAALLSNTGRALATKIPEATGEIAKKYLIKKAKQKGWIDDQPSEKKKKYKVKRGPKQR